MSTENHISNLEKRVAKLDILINNNFIEINKINALIYPINYDFGKNWTHIKPFLDNPTVLKALTRGVNRYLSEYPTNKKYIKNTCPASYSSTDGYYMLMDRKRDILLEKLRKEQKLPKKFLTLERKLKTNDEYFCEYMETKDEILKPYFTWEKIKYDIESYWLHMSCHSYAPTFELTLAKLVEPNEKWRVLSGNDHSTVINANNTKVFDLLYWCIDQRIENRMFGDIIPEKDIDSTLGGRIAYINSIKPIVYS